MELASDFFPERSFEQKYPTEIAIIVNGERVSDIKLIDF